MEPTRHRSQSASGSQIFLGSRENSKIKVNITYKTSKLDNFNLDISLSVEQNIKNLTLLFAIDIPPHDLSLRLLETEELITDDVRIYLLINFILSNSLLLKKKNNFYSSSFSYINQC